MLVLKYILYNKIILTARYILNNNIYTAIIHFFGGKDRWSAFRLQQPSFAGLSITSRNADVFIAIEFISRYFTSRFA